MKTKTPLILALAFTLLMGGTNPSPFQHEDVTRGLASLTKRGFTYHLPSSDLVEIEFPIGEKQIFSLREQSEARIRTWARSRGVPILEIDPALIDTTPYAGWYKYWQQLPISQSPGKPVVVADVDKNNIAEVYGLVTIPGSPTVLEARICEVEPPTFAYTYLPYPGIPTGIVNIDSDNSLEVLFSGQSGLILTDFRQQQANGFPTVFNFSHMTTNSGVVGGYVAPVVGRFDGDSNMQCLYKVVEVDSSDTSMPYVRKAVIAKYDTLSRDLRRVVSIRVPPIGQQDDETGQFAVADFDRNGKMDFVTTGGLLGHVFVFENEGNNAYALVYQDSTPFVNLYRVTTGDVDNNGKPEFFVAATQGNGQWALAYEADTANRYSPKFLFHFLSGGSIDFPTYLTADVDGDSKLELLTTSGSHIFIFKSDTANSYRLWYYRHEDVLNAVQVYDFHDRARMDLVVSKDGVDSLGRLRYYSDLYLATPLLIVEDQRDLPQKIQLFQNYPNPFNSSTVISYELAGSGHARITIFDLLGREVLVLVDETQPGGYYSTVWNATGMATGMYPYRLQVREFSMTKKLLLIR
ncbi:MAG TPA: hypothetical protein DGH68_07875 [Bacteroidetes bacterium]|jgi:hypothetical protein|nr:hypothetical protein [Bacteroidota bacterium]